MAKPFTIVYTHEHDHGLLQVAMAANQDIHIRIVEQYQYQDEHDHVLTMADFDQLVEKVHEFHAEVEGE